MKNGHEKEYYIGIDVQVKRGCPYAVFNHSLQMVDSGWIPGNAPNDDLITQICSKYPNAHVGLDCPRMPLPAPRQWYWQRNTWTRRTTQKGVGRHCEVAVKALNLANPQWTPMAEEAPEWMQTGFSLFTRFGSRCRTYEAFPSASYQMLETLPSIACTLSFDAFRPGPKDMLDAVIAALTVAEFVNGRGCEVGGGDGLGTIILPGPLKDAQSRVLQWPG